MRTFKNWFSRQTKKYGNHKLFRNRSGMELAWDAGQAEQRQRCADKTGQVLVSWIDEAATRRMIEEVADACLNATGESDEGS